MEVLAVLKPDGVLRRAAGAGILKGILDSKLGEPKTFAQITVPVDLLDQHYAHVTTRSFYPWLRKYMSGGPSYVLLLETNAEALAQLRDLLGATRAHLAKPETLRYKYSPFGGANGLHLSEDANAAQFETALWKDKLGIRIGTFDLAVEDYIESNSKHPDLTAKLRELSYQVEAQGQNISEEAMGQFRDLLTQECVNASAEELEFMVWLQSASVFA